ncbi:MAG: class E sortase [Ilumatobacteraceae bacterium]
MKGRRLLTSMGFALLSVTLSGVLAGCSSGGSASQASTVLPAEPVGEAMLADVESTIDIASPTTAQPTTTAPVTTPSSTGPAPTEPPTTDPPTVVETLPQPAPPPEPRADEPYVELGTLEIPKLGIVAPLLEGITLTTLDLGPGHWPGTAMPGRLGNVVIAGHRTSHGKVFRDIDRLVVGDEVVFTTEEGRFVYVVTGTDIVQPDALYIIDQTPEKTATLFACHPPGSTRQRIVTHLALQDGTTSG